MKSVLECVRVAGISAAVPAYEETVLDSEYGTPSSRERFVRTTGVERRRLASSDQWCSDLAHAAAERLLEELKWDRNDVDLLVFVTQTPDLKLPASACILQHSHEASRVCVE
ncbi:MAG: ketoacyl-ACP synthase III, partial [Leptolyngbya sp. SIO3F4]|nr:ketoacyl-ACP synthase III [Leptolyngbya sp. SIO3F4]